MTDTPRPRRRWSLSLIVGLILLAGLVVTSIAAPLLLSGPADSLTQDVRSGPSAAHWFGTDAFGRDNLARALVATRLTLIMAGAATLISVALGVAIGVLIWVAPRRVRVIAQRLVDAVVAYPALIFALVIAAILGAGASSAVVAIGVAGVPAFARITSNLAKTVSVRDYVSTARLLGVPRLRLAGRHILPNIAEPLLVLSTSSFALSLLEISSLSFVGLGVQSPEYDWGKLLNDGLGAIYTVPTQVVPPSLMLIISGVAAMLIGDGVAGTVERRKLVGRGRLGTRSTGIGLPDASASRAVVEVGGLTVTTAAGREIVRGVSFEVGAGEIVGVVGETGSGKSMTAMALAGLLPVGVTSSADMLRVGALDMTGRPSPREMATSIGLVYQDPGSSFNPALRMGRQLTETLRVHLGRRRRRADADIVGALTEMRITDPEGRLGQRPHELSGGMLQRAMIASGIVTRPGLLIADEATTALDVTVQAEVLRLIHEANRSHGMAVLFISHDIAVVRSICDRVLVMNSGVIVEQLTATELGSGTAKHPYTRALLSAVPSMTARAERLMPVTWKGEGS